MTSALDTGSSVWSEMMDIAEMAGSAGPAVVGVRGGGSGVVVAAGRVLTLASRLRTADVEVVFVATGEAPALGWSDAGPPAIGAPVLALADPGGSGLRVTQGAVSAGPL